MRHQHRPRRQVRVEPAAEAEAHERPHASVGDPAAGPRLRALGAPGGRESHDVPRPLEAETKAAQLALQARDDSDFAHAVQERYSRRQSGMRAIPRRALMARRNVRGCPVSRRCNPFPQCRRHIIWDYCSAPELKRFDLVVFLGEFFRNARLTPVLRQASAEAPPAGPAPGSARSGRPGRSPRR
jgi:hypothetical protein